MDNGKDFRGWDFWVQQRRIGMHIVDAWPGNALKVVSKAALPVDKWTHVVVTYDGSAKADGLKIYYNGKPQFVNVEQDKLTGSIKTQVPFKAFTISASTTASLSRSKPTRSARPTCWPRL
jgi:hypothetical protein